LILTADGNLLIKDNVRTQWQTNTARIKQKVPPYSLHFSPNGTIYIVDSWFQMIWTTTIVNPVPVEANLSMRNDGNLIITNSLTGQTIWDLWNGGNATVSTLGSSNQVIFLF
jgi:hypothetical protein